MGASVPPRNSMSTKEGVLLSCGLEKSTQGRAIWPSNMQLPAVPVSATKVRSCVVCISFPGYRVMSSEPMDPPWSRALCERVSDTSRRPVRCWGRKPGLLRLALMLSI